MGDVSEAGSSKLRHAGAACHRFNPCTCSATVKSFPTPASSRTAVLIPSVTTSEWESPDLGRRGHRQPTLARPSDLSRFPFGRGAFTGERLLYARSSQGVWRLDAVEQPIRTGIKKLRKPGESCQRDGIIAPFDVANRFPMHAHQLSQALLSHVVLQPSVSNLPADQPEHLSISHTPSWNGYAPLLTPRIDSIKSWPCLTKGWMVTVRPWQSNTKEAIKW